MSRRGKPPLPPQPPGRPVVGNLLDMPPVRPWEWFVKCSQELGSDVLYINLAGAGLIILNSYEAAIDLLDKRSGIYSDRSQSVLVDDLAGFGYLLSRREYGDAWRERRRMFHEHLRVSKSNIYEGKILEQVRRTVLQIVRRSPDDVQDIFRHMTGGIAVSLAYGLPIQVKDDPSVTFSEGVNTAVNVIKPAEVFIVNHFPFLKYVPAWFPGAGFKRRALKLGSFSFQFREKLFAEAQDYLRTEHAAESLTSRALDGMRASGTFNLDAIKDTAAVIFAAGSETTYTTLTLWIRAMLVHPDIQGQLHQELDSVLGDRLPEFSDLKNLPLLEASVMESIRLYTTLPSGVPHASTKDDVYRGYFIPKGIAIIPNAWAMLHNEKDYPEPLTYKPSRFIKDGAIDEDVLDPRKMAFGFGRRICAGAHIANAALLMSAATVMLLFDIQKSNEDDEISMDAEPGNFFRPIPYKCAFKVRNKVAESIIENLENSLF
ncbi:cytochrome P450 [Coprinopsis marcescibilis]|uniref:Cytochrome P450 n=1 Tax=Coprinopsis marcescibilis TaxID=230819 RepID=A0A5C3L7D9_COPMA|nr:cytochrome P450 [Coprinopsis marcescibilis]